MTVATDRFIASFGDDLLEFELAIESIEYVDGEAVVEWSVDKLSDRLGGITWEILLNTTGGMDTAVRTNTGYRGSGTLRAPSSPGDIVDLILYDTFNTDHEPGDGLTGPGQAQVNVETPFPDPDPDLVTVPSCDGTQTVDPGEDALVDVTIANENIVDVDATLTVSVGPTEAVETVTVPAEGEADIQTAHALEDAGEYDVTVSVSI